jgi:hypothetical protein
VCAGPFLFHSSGWNQYVGSACAQALLLTEHACVGGFLYKADGTSVYVGASGCQSVRPR